MSSLNAAALSALAKGDLDNAMVASTPGGIEQQERAGQLALVSNFTRLPKDFGYNREFPTAILERLGFKVGEPVDELFVSVEAPAGWSMGATEHSMHSDILDDRRRIRGSVFYKAAFYDRKASFYLSPRYSVQEQYDSEGKPYAEWRSRIYLKDGADDAHVLDFDWRNCQDDGAGSQSDREKCRTELILRFPHAEDVEAYW